MYTTPLTPAFLTTSSTQQDIMAARYVSLNLTSHQCCISDLKGLMTNNQPELNEKTKQKWFYESAKNQTLIFQNSLEWHWLQALSHCAQLGGLSLTGLFFQTMHLSAEHATWNSKCLLNMVSRILWNHHYLSLPFQRCHPNPERCFRTAKVNRLVTTVISSFFLTLENILIGFRHL